MPRLPWRRDADGAPDDAAEPAGADGDPLVVCRFQDGTVSVYEDRVVIERAGPSRFPDKTIPREELVDVTYAKGFAIGHLQFVQEGFENDTGGFLTSPVDENTLHFGRGARDCAERARDAARFGTV